ncbi:type II toxin-antitoxin system RelE/ParE family toxin [Methanohalophilus sp.]|uniref:type II toxin-antitoxin system RelE family toxin n=1 Tax=Methanohalophilus sp. TaxID=1966352 RepID=UPI00260C99F7|nr:type II toxin-antitoxin system RelE/ParE family toxin [Methanohalophilus sp.]MDK2892842.1 mRNA interferase RelE/StbE [Methanohalophilus sp.]
MEYKIEIHTEVQKFLNAQDSKTQHRLIKGLKRLKNDPLSHDIKKLKGTKGRPDLYRLRIGNYRAIFSIEDDTVKVIEIIPREKGYGWLALLLVA